MKKLYLLRVILFLLLTTFTNLVYGQITATFNSANDLVLDSNKPFEEGPSTAYMAFLIKNTGVGPVLQGHSPSLLQVSPILDSAAIPVGSKLKHKL